MNEEAFKRDYELIKKELISRNIELDEKTVEEVLNAITKVSNYFTDARCKMGIVRVVNLSGRREKPEIVSQEEFVLPLFVDNNNYSKGDEVVIDYELLQYNGSTNAFIYSIVKHLRQDAYQDLLISKTFLNEENLYKKYVAKMIELGFKTVSEVFPAEQQSANQDKIIANELDLDRPGPRIVVP